LAKRDYYDVLGVGKGASKDEIKKAYRRLAVQFHPDRNPGDKQAEDKFKAATEAYEVLADQKKRQAYDQFGFSGLDGMGFGAHDFSSVFHDFEDIFDGFNFTGFFDSFFGGGGRSRSRTGSGRSSARRGADLRYDLEISFADEGQRQKDLSFLWRHGAGSAQLWFLFDRHHLSQLQRRG
jgi:molecular chaperone DnaJ